MQTRWFWRLWSKEYRIIGYGIAVLFTGALLFMWYSYFVGVDAVLHWEKQYDQKPVETIAHTFQVGNYEFAVPIESYLTFEYFQGSNLTPNLTASYIFIVLLVTACVILFTIVTTFPRFWYLLGAGLFIVILISLRLDVLRIFGFYGQWTTLGTILVYVGVSYYFNAFRSATPFFIRLITFLGITVVIGIIIYLFAGVSYPFLHLSVAGYIAGMILTVLFTIVVAHEILASFVYLTSQGTTTSKSLNHFLVISVVYLANLIVAYMHEAGMIHWNFLYINLYLLLTISAILGIWGYRQREILYKQITYFNPFAAYGIAAIASIAFTTLGLLLSTANDPALKVLRDFIIFSHLGFGLMFMLYIFSNFMIMMAENLNVYKVLYNPNRMPYITYRLAGTITMLGFVFYMNWHDYVYNASSGLYNSMGDLYALMEKNTLAEAYYQQGRSFGFQNNRSNYVLATLETQKNNLQEAYACYNRANAKRPTAYSLVNESNLYLYEDQVFKAIFRYKQALNTFPESGVIQNNLGYAFTKIHALDSGLLLFERAREHRQSKETAEINFTAFLAQEYMPIQGDSLVRLFNTQSAGVLSNALILATSQHQSFSMQRDPLSKAELDFYSATMLNNFMVNKLKQTDTAFVAQALRIASDSSNAGYSEALKASMAHVYYHQNNVNKSLQLLGELAYLSQSRQGKYNYIMGLWALEQGNAFLAAQCFEYAVQANYKEARAYYAIALAESRQIDKIGIAIDTLLQSKREEEVEIGKQLHKTFQASIPEILQASDAEKYQYCRLRIKLSDSLTFNRVANTITDENYRAKAILDRSQQLFEQGETEVSIRYFTKLAGLRLTSSILFNQMQHFELALLAARGQLRLLAEKINEGITFSRPQELEKLLYSAMFSEVNGDTITAAKNYEILAAYNPFFEEGVIAAARYFKQHGTDPLRAYTILTDAMHVNQKSVRLLTAYIAEATRMGFDNYAADADAELQEIVNRE